jgi:hypothetical protein
MTLGSLLGSFGGAAVGALATYVTFYLRGALARREQVARSLADFYASAAAAYYASRDYERMPSDHANHFAMYNLFDQHYKQFLSASTYLASLIHPKLREDVLKMEDIWDEMHEKGISLTRSKAWLDSLDALRDKILNSVAYNRLTDPFWKFR